MCGIVGYVVGKEVQRLLMSGLKRLEYRGYDSASIVILGNKDGATLLYEKNKVAELKKKVISHVTGDTVGIGHTR